ncbi:MAG TPA: AAA family ATPase [Gaiellaceae bacterium]|nr:AAA family ATPase [Gaiellaceae bacterium]
MRILVTGVSGTGKSTVLAELARRGFRTVDTDEPGWTWEDADGGRWWDEEKIGRLLEEDEPALFVSGTVTNQGRFYDRFDAVVLLSASEEVILERIATRTNNPWGKSTAERELILEHIGDVEPLLRATCTHEIDTSAPLADVVERLVEIAAS